MEFQRARSKEQLAQREQDIIRSAIAIFEEQGFEEVTFSKIAQSTAFTRPTIYTYFKTREEILLRMVHCYFEQFVEAIALDTEQRSDRSPEALAVSLTRAFAAVPQFMRLYSILYSVIERNVSVEALAQFKREILALQHPMVTCLREFFPRATDEALYQFLVVYLSLASGLYPMTVLTDNQREAILKSETGYTPPCFEDVFQAAILVHLRELEKG